MTRPGGDVFNTRCAISYHKQAADKIKVVCMVGSVDGSLRGSTFLVYLFIRLARISYGRFIAVSYKFKMST